MLFVTHNSDFYPIMGIFLGYPPFEYNRAMGRVWGGDFFFLRFPILRFRRTKKIRAEQIPMFEGDITSIMKNEIHATDPIK